MFTLELEPLPSKEIPSLNSLNIELIITQTLLYRQGLFAIFKENIALYSFIHLQKIIQFNTQTV